MKKFYSHVMSVVQMLAICSCNDTPKSSMDEAPDDLAMKMPLVNGWRKK